MSNPSKNDEAFIGSSCFQLGLPSFALKNICEKDILGLPINHIEIGFESVPAGRKWRAFCEKNDISYSVHVPCPKSEKVPIANFSPTSQVRFRCLDAYAMTKKTIQEWADSSVKYVVVHYPSASIQDMNDNVSIDTNNSTWFLEKIDSLAQTYNVKILIENLTVNPLCCEADHYKKILNKYNNLDLCFDIGHAFLVNGHKSVAGFVNNLSDRIGAIHLYDYKIDKNGKTKSPFGPCDASYFGSFDELMSLLTTNLQNPIIIHEAKSSDSFSEKSELERSLMKISNAWKRSKNELEPI